MLSFHCYLLSFYLFSNFFTKIPFFPEHVQVALIPCIMPTCIILMRLRPLTWKSFLRCWIHILLIDTFQYSIIFTHIIIFYYNNLRTMLSKFKLEFPLLLLPRANFNNLVNVMYVIPFYLMLWLWWWMPYTNFKINIHGLET